MVQAHDEASAFERLAEGRAALVLVDLNMTETNGFALIRELRKQDEWRDVPVIALSAQELTADQCKRLDGRVQQIINTENEAPDALLAILRRIPAPPAVREKRAAPR